MKIHLRIPHFQAVIAALEEDVNGPLVVVDESRILEANPEAVERGFSPRDLLETTSIPDDVTETPFDLDLLEAYQRTFHEEVQSVVPVAESFGFGEVLAEVSDGLPREQLPDLSGFPDEFTPCVAGSSTSWLSRVLNHRLARGEVLIRSDNKYDDTLNSVRREELWGLGPELPRRMRGSSLETLGALQTVQPSQRRELLGPSAAALKALYESRDPRPLNPFSRPAKLRQGFSAVPGNAERLRLELKFTVRSLIESLRKTDTRAHRLLLSYSRGNHDPHSATYVYSSPTDEEEILLFGSESLLSDLKPPDGEGDLHVEVSGLVPNIETYHTSVEDNPEDLTVL